MVVESDDTSTQIIRHLNSQKGGRVTFIPLNRVRAPRITYPQSSDVIPLLKKLNFKHDYTPAFSQVSFYIDVIFYLQMVATSLGAICLNSCKSKVFVYLVIVSS